MHRVHIVGEGLLTERTLQIYKYRFYMAENFEFAMPNKWRSTYPLWYDCEGGGEACYEVPGEHVQVVGGGPSKGGQPF